MSRTRSLLFAGLLAISLFSGCASIDPEKERREQTQSFTNHLAHLEQQFLKNPLTLDECIHIAMTNSYTVRKSDLEQKLARLNRDTTFSTFLPEVKASAGIVGFGPLPAGTPLADQFNAQAVSISMPLFAPTTWFLFGAAQDGYISSKLVSAYTRQNLSLQVSVNGYKLLVQTELVRALESQLAASIALTNRIQGLAREGFIRPWEQERAHLLVLSHKNDLDTAQRKIVTVRAELLQSMGLSPLAPLTLAPDLPPQKIPQGDCEARVLKALEIHPELAIADRMIVMRENQVRLAFARFLPVVGAVAEYDWVNLDSLNQLVPTQIWLAGFSASWTIFKGFENVNKLRMAKAAKTVSELERERTFLSVIVRVVAADAAWRDATETARLAQAAFTVSQNKLADYEARLKEGLIPLSDALDVRAEMDAAQIRFLQASYLERIALSNLELAMGLTALPE